ncbi:hypothetical protein Pelo_19714 [Pelomyxa schiedti]|nr:hypothetical protein Pelo_19714 [Pelomyxa schiedti]
MLESNYHACSSLLMTDDDFALFTVDTYHHISPAMLFCMEGIVPEIPKAWALHLLSYDKCCSLPDTAIWIITTFAESQEQKRDLVFSLRERAKKCPSGGSNILAAWCDGYLGD